ncbi:zinc phosphodiesterase ELAC protein 2 [Caerostris darwini]|uniref:ribonuclease Z n=1 Tax=Caerostris darwini TaxID=1538125 RepID=A0AAV4R8G2_9ARAC|nr:zinc phosphodiesterase ELAC protein 2 [Caerostris darwini]
MCITIFGNGAVGQPRCIGIFTEFKGFLFNCGEGVGRFCKEYETPTYLIKHLFVTQNIWRNVSGFADIYLSNYTMNVCKMSIYGPPGIEYFDEICKAHHNSLKLRRRSSYNDENMEVVSIPMKSSVSHYRGNTDTIFSYACKVFKKFGNLNPDKCYELKVPVGPHLINLKNGEDVTLTSGRVIYSADILGPSCPAMTMLVVDCPSHDFLDPFVNEEQFRQYQCPMDGADEVSYVFHFSPPHIIKSLKYQRWMQRFHLNVHHYILNSSNSSLSSEAVTKSQNLLHQFHPEIFKLLPEDKAEPLPLNLSSKIFYTPPMFQIHLRPERKLSCDNVLKPNFEDCDTFLIESPDFSKELTKLKNLISTKTSIKGSEYPEVIFLGTGSATSSAIRNVSAILVNLNPDNSILLDCGEGTFMQLVRYFGKSNVASILRKISCIFITHRHIDHFLGLFEIIKARMEAFENTRIPYKQLALILPSEIRLRFFRFCEIYENLKPAIRIFSCRKLASEGDDHIFISNFLRDTRLLTVPVKHCSDAYGIVLQQGSDWKITYSGDTAPCQTLIDAGKDSTLLIHEASIEDNLLSEATQKLHSTPAQVIDVAEQMNAQHVIMTHFSKRYLAGPSFEEGHRMNVGYSFDFMKVRLNELPVLPLFVPALKCLFQENLESFSEISSTLANTENIFLKILRAAKNN